MKRQCQLNSNFRLSLALKVKLKLLLKSLLKWHLSLLSRRWLLAKLHLQLFKLKRLHISQFKPWVKPPCQLCQSSQSLRSSQSFRLKNLMSNHQFQETRKSGNITLTNTAISITSRTWRISMKKNVKFHTQMTSQHWSYLRVLQNMSKYGPK
jgi:hypothetical protein